MVAETVKAVAYKSAMSQTADTLRYLYMGRRIGRAAPMDGLLLHSKPLIGAGGRITTSCETHSIQLQRQLMRHARTLDGARQCRLARSRGARDEYVRLLRTAAALAVASPPRPSPG